MNGIAILKISEFKNVFLRFDRQSCPYSISVRFSLAESYFALSSIGASDNPFINAELPH
jgi:hypothetical protein